MNSTLIPYGRHQVGADDIEAVVRVLNSSWLTTGPKVAEFENAVAAYTGAKYAVAVSSGTAALHCAAYALGIEPGDEVIVPALTFAATANCVAALGGTPVVVDVHPETLLIDVAEIQKHVTARTKAIIAVDYAGQPCNYDMLHEVADRYGLHILADACHALGACFNGVRTGQLADLTVFSFHPVKHITTGEGGMVVTNHARYAEMMRRFRNHGITADHHQRSQENTWHYEVADIGFNYRITDIQCALGISQLGKLDGWLARRREIAGYYADAFGTAGAIRPLKVSQGVDHAYHLYVVRLDTEQLSVSRAEVFQALRESGIGANVHYPPLNLQPYYQNRFGAYRGQCPAAEAAYEQLLSLPIYPSLTAQDIERVTATLDSILSDI
ncbi:MAG: UDP-4-amino-4,6-dideoxy-N-acetyl-beta-L-altrosamine transaminase [Desulfobacterales bacterium]|nr:MAG: UDP-4-amino-4,6-dideoxy-N-acetyl-beta-L-altrosamine transaminase [Desulfobacterales bacterium]